ncbi:MAG: hypothetical protein GC179_09700 [Anaerolineaceae bacterium]|nr:hypothetical protein [Anaerolineaceae bacterium]
MNLSQPQSKYCQFKDLNNGIWKFFFVEASNRAVDEWYEWQSYLKAASPAAADERVRMLLDMRKSGTLPLLYTLQQGRDWRKQYDDINKYQVYIALLLKPFPNYQQPYIRLIKDGVNVFTLEQVKVELFFDAEQKAIDWLLKK